jgi:hypothetical protein
VWEAELASSLLLPCLPVGCAVVQVSDEEKRQRADYVISTGCSLQETEQQVGSILQELLDSRQGAAAARLLNAPKQQQ